MTEAISSRPNVLVNELEVCNFLKVNKLGVLGQFLSKGLLKLTKIEQLNKAYAERSHLNAVEFIDSIFDYLGVSYQLYEKDIKRLPKSGAFITVSNHPLGGIDGMILIKTILQQREDFKVMANFMLNRVAPLQPYILPVNPFEDYKSARSSLQGLKKAIEQLRKGSPLGIFPAGEVSTMHDTGKVLDRDWSDGAIKLIIKAQVPVIPIYFEAHNSAKFYKMAKLSGVLRTALLPSEMTTQHKRKIVVRIGNPIKPREFEGMNVCEIKSMLRQRTYFLAHGCKPKRDASLSMLSMPEVCAPLSSASLQIEASRAQALIVCKKYKLFLTTKKDSPNLIQEIGRLRELTFRSVGEGTLKEKDLDMYDEYYRHLVLYDTESNKLVGAYRLGIGAEIYDKLGVGGFYLSTLFRFDEPFHKVLSESIELGRAFIVQEYQRSPMSLYLLWKGIVMTLIQYNAKYMLGGVSISNDYCDTSKSVIVQLMKTFYTDNELSPYVHARNEYMPSLESAEWDLISKGGVPDMKKIDGLIDELEPEQAMKVPVLLKKYLKQNARLVGFNIDADFNNAIDGLMVARLDRLPQDTIDNAQEALSQMATINQEQMTA